MSLVHTHNFGRSLRNAIRGLAYIYQTERNFQIHLVFAVLAILLSVALSISVIQWLFILTAIASVLTLEIVNTVFEKLIDLFQPRIHHYAGIIKDLMAATVLVATCAALLIGALIFIPSFLSYFR
jgi:diacylglycerol kinase